MSGVIVFCMGEFALCNNRDVYMVISADDEREAWGVASKAGLLGNGLRFRMKRLGDVLLC